MKAIYHEKKGSSVVEKPYPLLEKATDVIIKIEVGALCRTDVYVHMDKIPASEKVVLGHECSGIVVEKGTGVNNLEIGDRVSINPFIGCGNCDKCKENNYQLCLEQKMLGKEVDGVFTEYFKIDQSNVVKFSKKISPQKAAFFEPVLAMAAILETSIKKESEILVYGQNRIAELTKRILNVNGFEKVVCEIPENTNKKYDYVIETVPRSEGFNRAVKMLKTGGTLILKSRLFNPLEVDLFQILQNNIKLESAYYYQNIEHAREMLENDLEIDDLIGETYKFEQFEKVFEDSLKGESLKTYLEV